MGDSSLYSGTGGQSDHETTQDLWVLIGILGTALAAAVWPTVGGPVVVGGITLITELNIRSPDPWDRGSTAWNDMSDHFAQIKNRMTTYRNDVDGYWRDKGAEAFKTFLEGHLEPALNTISSAATNVRNMCDDMWWGLVTILVSYIGFTVSALVAALAAYLSGPYTPAVQWAIVGIWAGLAIAAVLAFVTLAQQVWTAGRDLGDAFSDLTNMFRQKGDQLDTDTLNLPDQVRVRLGDPHNWVKE
jgi:hypothetical protein